MLETTGVVSKDKLIKKIDDLRNSNKTSGAIIECYQNIPCNPCSTSCPTGAIEIKPDINATPVIDYEKCTSCGICVYHCPGLAIFVLDLDYSNDNALFKISYELLPYPNKGDIVKGINRKGEVICDAEVVRVMNGKVQDKTALVSVSVPKQYVEDFVTIKVGA